MAFPGGFSSYEEMTEDQILDALVVDKMNAVRDFMHKIAPGNAFKERLLLRAVRRNRTDVTTFLFEKQQVRPKEVDLYMMIKEAERFGFYEMLMTLGRCAAATGVYKISDLARLLFSAVTPAAQGEVASALIVHATAADAAKQCLVAAVEENAFYALRPIIQKGADPNADEGEVLSYAVSARSFLHESPDFFVDTIKHILEAGFSQGMQMDDALEYCLHMFEKGDQLQEIIPMLLLHGADPFLPGDESWLMQARLRDIQASKVMLAAREEKTAADRIRAFDLSGDFSAEELLTQDAFGRLPVEYAQRRGLLPQLLAPEKWITRDVGVVGKIFAALQAAGRLTDAMKESLEEAAHAMNVVRLQKHAARIVSPFKKKPGAGGKGSAP